MKGFQLGITGNWAHFKKPETNNNPLSHDIITKTAFIGLIGAVLGIERTKMREYFPLLSEDLLYGVQLESEVKKLSCGFTSRTAINPTAPGNPKYFELLSKPAFKVSVGLSGERSQDIFNQFHEAVLNEEAVYSPVLGWHNCPANLTYLYEGEFSKMQGVFSTKGFVKAGEHRLENADKVRRIGFDRLPTYQNNDFWNLPEKYISVIYPHFGSELEVEGDYYEFDFHGTKEQLWMM